VSLIRQRHAETSASYGVRMSAIGRNVGKIKGRRKHKGGPAPVAISVAELRDLLGGISRDAAYALARGWGRRIGGKRGRLVIPLAKVRAWLAGEEGAAR